ncbi:hypothetical protein JCM5353_008777 [Sporobolomyces roseus]
MIPYLPTELLGAILSNVSTRSDLARCCSTSKTFLSISRPLLYDEVTLDLRDGYVPDVAGEWTTQNDLVPAYLKLISTLKSSPPLGQLVQKVNFYGAGARGVEHFWVGGKDREVKLKEVLDEIMNTFPLTKLVHFGNLSNHVDLDEAVHSLQLRKIDSQHSPTLRGFSLLIRGGLGDQPRFLGSYERFAWSSFSTVSDPIDLADLLSASQSTLKRLHIPLFSSTSLALFQNLERLCLRLFVQTPSNVVSSLSNILSDLPSLRTLLLHGPAREEDLGSLLTSGLLAQSLPPALSHLSLAFKLTPNELLAFLQELPTTSNLRRFNCLSEMGKFDGVEEEFSRRGIRLSYEKSFKLWW